MVKRSLDSVLMKSPSSLSSLSAVTGGVEVAFFLKLNVKVDPDTCTLAKFLLKGKAGFTFLLRINLVIILVGVDHVHLLNLSLLSN